MYMYRIQYTIQKLRTNFKNEIVRDEERRIERKRKRQRDNESREEKDKKSEREREVEKEKILTKNFFFPILRYNENYHINS